MRAAWGLLVLGLLGCGYTRVTVPPPKLDGTEEARNQAWTALAPVNVEVEETYRLQGPGSPGIRGLKYDLSAIQLGSGLLVEDPRDLAPIVPNSKTAEVAQRWGAGRDRWDAHLWAALGIFAGATVGLLTMPYYADALGPARANAVMIGWMVAGLVGPLVNILIPAIFVGKIDHLRIEAFRTYAADLQQQFQATP